MLTDDTAITAQLVRLSVLRGKPDDVNETIRAFRKAAQNGAHLRRIVEQILRYEEWFPAPAAIYNAASAVSAAGDEVEYQRKCQVCDSTRYVQAWRLETTQKHPTGGVYKGTDVITDAAAADKLKALIAEQWKAGVRTQMIYDCVKPCPHCTVVVTAPEPAPKTGKRPRGGLRRIESTHWSDQNQE